MGGGNKMLIGHLISFVCDGRVNINEQVMLISTVVARTTTLTYKYAPHFSVQFL